jgi:hypothetical protein
MILDDIGDKGDDRIHTLTERTMLHLQQIHKLRVHQIDKVARIKHVQRPDYYKHKQGHGSLVDLRHALKGYKQVAHDKHDDDCD